jgi:hypothetical protein
MIFLISANIFSSEWLQLNGKNVSTNGYNKGNTNIS